MSQKHVVYNQLEDYEPSEEGICRNTKIIFTEVVDYAKFLGIDPLTEPQFLWIAREGLKAPLPEGWKAL